MAKQTAIEKATDLSPTYTALRKLQTKFQKRFDESFLADDFEDLAILENAIEAFKQFEATLWQHCNALQNASGKDRKTDLQTFTVIETQKQYIALLERNYLHLHGLIQRNNIRKPTAPDSKP